MTLYLRAVWFLAFLPYPLEGVYSCKRVCPLLTSALQLAHAHEQPPERIYEAVEIEDLNPTQFRQLLRDQTRVKFRQMHPRPGPFDQTQELAPAQREERLSGSKLSTSAAWMSPLEQRTRRQRDSLHTRQALKAASSGTKFKSFKMPRAPGANAPPKMTDNVIVLCSGQK